MGFSGVKADSFTATVDIWNTGTQAAQLWSRLGHWGPSLESHGTGTASFDTASDVEIEVAVTEQVSGDSITVYRFEVEFVPRTFVA